jgi:hypothetical protein
MIDIGLIYMKVDKTRRIDDAQGPQDAWKVAGPRKQKRQVVRHLQQPCAFGWDGRLPLLLFAKPPVSLALSLPFSRHTNTLAYKHTRPKDVFGIPKLPPPLA